MMEKLVATIEEAEAIVNPLMAEDKWAITVAQKADGTYRIQWMEQKMYTAFDGKEYRDEVWTTEQGEMKLIQDLTPEHARNIIRMMLRNEREAKSAVDALFQRVAEGLLEGMDEDLGDFSIPPITSNGTLH